MKKQSYSVIYSFYLRRNKVQAKTDTGSCPTSISSLTNSERIKKAATFITKSYLIDRCLYCSSLSKVLPVTATQETLQSMTLKSNSNTVLPCRLKLLQQCLQLPHQNHQQQQVLHRLQRLHCRLLQRQLPAKVQRHSSGPCQVIV